MLKILVSSMVIKSVISNALEKSKIASNNQSLKVGNFLSELIINVNLIHAITRHDAIAFDIINFKLICINKFLSIFMNTFTRIL